MIEAFLFVVLAVQQTRFVSHATDVPSLKPRANIAYDVERTTAILILFAIAVVGLLLRTHNLGQDLWLDKISPIVDYGRLSAAQVIGSYLRSNNHLMNTLLLKASIALFGQSEWLVRLPAVAFGVLEVLAVSDFIREMVRGVSAGFGSPIIALAFLIAGAAGFAALSARSWPLAIGLVLPEVVTLAALVSRGLTISPRFFLLAVPLAMLSAAAGLAMVIDWIVARQGLGLNITRVAWVVAIVLVVGLRSSRFLTATELQSSLIARRSPMRNRMGTVHP